MPYTADDVVRLRGAINAAVNRQKKAIKERDTAAGQLARMEAELPEYADAIAKARAAYQTATAELPANEVVPGLFRRGDFRPTPANTPRDGTAPKRGSKRTALRRRQEDAPSPAAIDDNEGW